jgi:hypothetical protein
MKSFNELIKNYSQPCRVTADFEDGVFSRIEKIKKMKKIGISGGAAFIVALVFSVLPGFCQAGCSGEPIRHPDG